MVRIKRKVIQIADSTMLISLPRNWVIKNNIKKGDELELTVEGSSIKVSSDSNPAAEETSIDVSGNAILIEKLLGALYKKGYDVVNIKFNGPKEQKHIHECIGKGLIGYEIVEEKNDRITIKSVSSLDPGQFDSMLRRCFLYLMSIAQDSHALIKEGKYSDFTGIALRDANINKITDFLRRSINKMGNPVHTRPAALYCIIEGIEKLGDYYKEMATFLAAKKTPIDPKTIKIFEHVSLYLRQLYNQFYDFKLKDFEPMIEEYKMIMDAIENTLTQEDNDTMRIRYHLETIAKGTYNLTGPLLVMHL